MSTTKTQTASTKLNREREMVLVCLVLPLVLYLVVALVLDGTFGGRSRISDTTVPGGGRVRRAIPGRIELAVFDSSPRLGEDGDEAQVRRRSYGTKELKALEGTYLTKLPLDPWGNDYRLDSASKTIISAGSDGQFGTQDDITTNY